MNHQYFIKKGNIVILFLPSYLYGLDRPPVEEMINLSHITNLYGDQKQTYIYLSSQKDHNHNYKTIALSYEQVKKIIRCSLQDEGETEPVESRFELMDI